MGRITISPRAVIRRAGDRLHLVDMPTRPNIQPGPPGSGRLLLAVWLGVITSPKASQNPPAQAFLKGDYGLHRQYERATAYDSIRVGRFTSALLAVGRYEQAETVVAMPWPVSAASAAGAVETPFTGQPDLAARPKSTGCSARATSVREPPDVITLGRMALELGARSRPSSNGFTTSPSARPQITGNPTWPPATWRWPRTITRSRPGPSTRRSRNSRMIRNYCTGWRAPINPTPAAGCWSC
jgi:hypothetical protein